MHEMGIMQGILDAAVEAAEGAGRPRISDIYLTIGELTEIQVFALDFAFEALAPGTIAEGAALHVTTLSPRSRCSDCGDEFEHDRFTMLCPVCGSFDSVLLQGRELQIDQIEAPDPDEDDAAATPSEG